MIKQTTIVLLILLGANCCPAQSAPSASPAETVQASAGRAATGSHNAQAQPLEVLFAANDDCRLFINEEPKGVVSKARFLSLSLAPGVYRYVAKSTATGDEWRDTFSVAAGKPNEIFVDVLYAIDAGRAVLAGIKNSSLLAVTAGSRKAEPGTKIAQKQATDLEKEQAAASALFAGMLPIKGGTFVMGNNKSPSADETEHPVLLNSFYISKYEVTQEQWEGIMGYNPSVHKDCPACPVENISWEEAMVFVRKLNGITGRKFRLPTEAEWEYVARMGGKAEIDKAGGAEAYIRKAAWAFTNSENKTHPVGKKQPNVSGVFDLFGNVSEWCMDWYGAFFYKEDFTEKDPAGPPLGKDKVIRGGNYKDFAGDRFRPSFRNKANPKAKGSEIGLRLVMEVQD